MDEKKPIKRRIDSVKLEVLCDELQRLHMERADRFSRVDDKAFTLGEASAFRAIAMMLRGEHTGYSELNKADLGCTE